MLRQRFRYDEATGKVVIYSYEDVRPILEQNRALRNADDRGYTPSREWRRVAQIPEIVVHMWLKEGISVYRDADWPKVAARLSSPEWAFLRTGPGEIRSRPFREYFRSSTGPFRSLPKTASLELVA